MKPEKGVIGIYNIFSNCYSERTAKRQHALVMKCKFIYNMIIHSQTLSVVVLTIPLIIITGWLLLILNNKNITLLSYLNTVTLLLSVFIWPRDLDRVSAITISLLLSSGFGWGMGEVGKQVLQVMPSSRKRPSFTFKQQYNDI